MDDWIVSSGGSMFGQDFFPLLHKIKQALQAATPSSLHSNHMHSLIIPLINLKYVLSTYTHLNVTSPHTIPTLPYMYFMQSPALF